MSPAHLDESLTYLACALLSKDLLSLDVAIMRVLMQKFRTSVYLFALFLTSAFGFANQAMGSAIKCEMVYPATVSERESAPQRQGKNKAAPEVDLKSLYGAFKLDSAPPENKAHFFSQLQKAISDNESELRQILLEFNNLAGNELEFKQVRKLLSGASSVEGYYLEHTRTLENVVIYGSTNVPLYTMVAHGLMAATISKNVWLRTPETTRDVYVKIYNVLKKSLPEGTLDSLHLITEKRDTNYDTFNQVFVMGLARNSNRVIRDPSELVVFTGNPETAKKMISRNEEKLKTLRENNPKAFKQVFVGFLAGINPTIITSSAGKNLSRIVKWTTEPLLINSGQDCMTSDVLFVHESVINDYVHKLEEYISQLKVGENGNPQAQITPLKMSKTMDNLLSYKEKYKKYLANNNASINTETKIVTPHIFVVPFEKFPELDIQEHFAPFLTLVPYKNIDDLTLVAKDVRIQNKAMFAIVLGEHKSNAETEEVKNLFRQNNHSVLVNDTLFQDVETNLPFGGTGTDSSLVYTVQSNKTGQVIANWAHYPTTISKEAFDAFGDNAYLSQINKRPQSYYVKQIKEVFAKDSEKNKNKHLNQQTEQRPYGLNYIREQIKEKGLLLINDNTKPNTKEELDYVQNMFGVDIMYTSDYVKLSEKPDKVVLVSTGIDEFAGLMQKIKADLNPHLGFKNYQSVLFQNKFNEYLFSEAILPGFMPATESYEMFEQAHPFSEKFYSQRQQLQKMLRSDFDREEIQSAVAEFADEFFKQIRQAYPAGAYMKNFSEYSTGDMGLQVNSFSVSPRALSFEFTRFVEMYRSKTRHQKQKFNKAHFKKEVLSPNHIYNIYNSFLYKLIFEPNDLLIQSRVKVAKTEMGFNKEFRVDFLDGETVSVRQRYGYDYLPEESRLAGEALNNFFSKAPEQLRRLSGAADIAILEDGSFVVFEFNFGGGVSGTLMPQYYPIESNNYYATLLGRPTRSQIFLEKIYAQGPERQKQLLLKLKNEKPVWWRTSYREVSRLEYAKWLRDRYLNDWQKNPTREYGETLIKQLESVLDGAFSAENRDPQKILLGAKYYILKRVSSNEQN